MVFFSIFLLTIILMYVIRYWLVYFNTKRAIIFASSLTNEHIKKCKKAFSTIKQIDMPIENYKECEKLIVNLLNYYSMYFLFYEKDFDFNKLWLDPYKWTLKQMYPTLMNTKVIEIPFIEGTTENDSN